MRHVLGKVWLLLVPPLALLVKDVIAAMAVLATEPGITAKAKFYYSIALLPGSFFADGAEAAMFYNVLCGASIGGALYLWAVRRAFARAKLHSGG